jgi:uncharacterized membrane protein
VGTGGPALVERKGLDRDGASFEIDAPGQRVWDVLSALEAWPQRIETVDIVELLTPAPITKGSRVRLKQPKLPGGTWDITVWGAIPFALRHIASGLRRRREQPRGALLS